MHISFIVSPCPMFLELSVHIHVVSYLCPMFASILRRSGLWYFFCLSSLLPPFTLALFNSFLAAVTVWVELREGKVGADEKKRKKNWWRDGGENIGRVLCLARMMPPNCMLQDSYSCEDTSVCPTLMPLSPSPPHHISSPPHSTIWKMIKLFIRYSLHWYVHSWNVYMSCIRIISPHN